MTARRGSVLIMALWIIAILSVMVVSFAFEARQQAGIDIYVRERNRVSRLIDSGRVLGEVVLLGYKDAPDPEIKSGAPDWDDAFEEDRWVVEKYKLKTDHKCKIGPIRLDEPESDEEDDGDAPTVTVELKFESATSKIDINSLTDDKGLEILKTVLRNSGIDDELEVEIEDANRSGKKRHNLMNLLAASWKDWRDEDDTVSRGPFEDGSDYRYDPQDDDGAEKSWYEERDEEDEIPVKDRRVPANGPIKQLEELSTGMQQKVQFIITILHEPKLMIFDEPFSGFDPVNAELLKTEILRLRDAGHTIIYSTHNMASVEDVCDDIALINNSRLVLSGSVEEVKHRFADGRYEVHAVTNEEQARALAESIPGATIRPILPSMNDIFLKVCSDNSKPSES